jgi:hypothetical protein
MNSVVNLKLAGAAAGINHLPETEYTRFLQAFVEAF